ncbi:hypothetical protein [Stappia stellulata]|uniref:hypothetical protein n=1 Tax=Stappia stellulata TaxID=71235 RepID=UPI0004067743|nr:hypothetical protein [Stappia stellulata]
MTSNRIRVTLLRIGAMREGPAPYRRDVDPLIACRACGIELQKDRRRALDVPGIACHETFADAGFHGIQITDVQRYGHANHLPRFARGEPGGHRASLSAFETPVRAKAHAQALTRTDATDTLVAIAST